MKTKRYLLLAVSGLAICVFFPLVDKSSSSALAAPAECSAELLSGLKHFTVIIELNDAKLAGVIGLTPTDLENIVSQKLTAAAVKVIDPLDPQAARRAPAKLKVSVLLAKPKTAATADLYAFCVQTGLWDLARLEKSPNELCFARLWHSKENDIKTAARKTAAPAVRKTVARQIEAFTKAYLAQNPPHAATGEKLVGPSPGPAKPPTQKVAESPKAEYNYVASKNSKVFHESTCSSARRISSKNLVVFHSRAEAMEAGKRPCKRCKP